MLFSIPILLASLATGQVSPSSPIVHTTKITAHFPFTTRGHTSWGNATAPTVDCQGPQFTGGSTWACTGSTLTKTGSPTASNATPFYPSGFSGTNFQGVRHDGTNDYWTVADPLGTLNSFRWCLAFRVEDATRTELIMGQDDTATNRKWSVSNTAGRLDFVVCKGNAACSTVSSAASALITGATHVACGSYDNSGGDGAAVLRLNTDGVAATAVTTGVSPPQAIAPNFSIGAGYPGTNKFKGVVAQATITKGSVATAAQLLAFVLAYWGEIGSSAQQVAVTRATTETCQINGANGTIYTMPNGVACVNENGLQVFAASTNIVPRGDELDNADWVATAGTPTVVAGAGASLYDTDTAGNVADSLEDDSGANAECIKAAARCGTTTGTYSASAYIKAVTGTTATIGIVTDGTGTAYCQTTTLSSSAYKRITCANKTIGGTPTSNDIWICPTEQDVAASSGKILVFGVQCEALANVTPVIRTAGATATRNAMLATAVNNGIVWNTGGQVCATVGPLASGWVATGDSGIVAFANAELYLSSKTGLAVYDGTNNCTVTISDTTTAARRVCGWWSSTSSKIRVYEVGGASNLCDFDGSMNAEGQAIQLGHRVSAANILDGPVNDVRLCRSPGGCE